jgi:hypothetical protein
MIMLVITGRALLPGAELIVAVAVAEAVAPEGSETVSVTVNMPTAV